MTNKEVYDKVARKILEILDKGTVPWKKNWEGVHGCPINGYTKKPYHGVNLYLMLLGHQSNEWFTIKQVNELGGRVKKGETAALVCFWKFFTPKAEKEAWNQLSDEDKETYHPKVIPMLHYYTVFNREQCEGLPEKEVKEREVNPIEAAEEIIKGYTDMPPVKYYGDRAFYSPSHDEITLPERKDFFTDEDFYATLFHESVHSTGHEKRLNRQIRNMFGDENYSFEELVAEFGSAFLCGKAGIEQKTVENAASYIEGWKTAIKSNSKALFDAISKAGKAVEYILGTNKEGDAVEE